MHYQYSNCFWASALVHEAKLFSFYKSYIYVASQNIIYPTINTAFTAVPIFLLRNGPSAESPNTGWLTYVWQLQEPNSSSAYRPKLHILNNWYVT
jgi:hypothetical protein